MSLECKCFTCTLDFMKLYELGMYVYLYFRLNFIIQVSLEYKCFTEDRCMHLRLNPLNMGNPITGTFTNSEDPDEMPHNAAFHQGLHCLLR